MNTKNLLLLVFVMAVTTTVKSQWQDISNAQLGDFFYVKFISPEHGWASVIGGNVEGLLRTTDGGLTWTKILDHQPGMFNWIYSFDFQNDSVGYAASARGLTCFRTLNGGHTWDTVACGSSCGPSPYTAMVTIKVFDIGIGYAGGCQEFYRSIDSLKSWPMLSYIPSATVDPPSFRFVFISKDTIVAYGGTETLLIGEWTGTIQCYKSTDGGLTWGFSFVDTLQLPHAAAFGNNSVGYAFTGIWRDPGLLGAHYKTHKTTNAGETWVQIPATLDTGGILVSDAYFSNPNEGFIVGGGVAHTSDGALTWHIVPNISGTKMSWPDSLHGWIFGNSGRIYRTTTGGALPIQLVSFNGTHIGGTRVRLDWRTASEVRNYGFIAMRRRESETTFTDISPLIPGHGTTGEPHDYSWTDENASVGRNFYKLRQIDLDGTNHFSETIQVDVVTSVGEQTVPNDFALYQNYPNPFNPLTTVKFDLPTESKVRLAVYDILGRKITDLASGDYPAGYHSFIWNAKDVASGVYFARFTATDANGNLRFTKVTKLMLMK